MKCYVFSKCKQNNKMIAWPYTYELLAYNYFLSIMYVSPGAAGLLSVDVPSR